MLRLLLLLVLALPACARHRETGIHKPKSAAVHHGPTDEVSDHDFFYGSWRGQSTDAEDRQFFYGR